jgi:high-affinity K+ transport system ATPase subunit B
MTRHKTALGKEFNMAAFSNANAEVIAIGNVLRNARGDIIDAKGRIIKTAKEVAESYYNTNPNAVKQISIKEDGSIPKALEADVPKGPTVVASEEIEVDGEIKIERTYSDGSMEIVDKPQEKKAKK